MPTRDLYSDGVADTHSEFDEVVRQFEAALSGKELDDLRSLSADLALAGWGDSVATARPNLLRPPREEVCVYRVRVDLEGARPPIWRRLELRSDLTLDVVHRVLQAAFGWFDYHLHRFSLGGGPFDRHSQFFLCPFDVEEGEDEGEPASEVRLDETLQDPGDVLTYLYDYGDSWELKIRLEEVTPPAGGAPVAVCVGGRRAAPPEDCGGLTDADSLAEVLDDPAHFDPAEVNFALNDPYFVLVDHFPPQLVEMVNRLAVTPSGDDLKARLLSLTEPMAVPSSEEKADALRAYMWFLDRAGGEGLELTAAGYLKPADVEAASQVVPAMRDWIGKNNREVNAFPLLIFRDQLRVFGLVRKYKGRLRLTRMAARFAGDADAVWRYLATMLVKETGDRFSDEATLMVLAYAATSTDGALHLDDVVEALVHLGWRGADGNPVTRSHLIDLEAVEVLCNVGDPPGDRIRRDWLSSEAVALARAAFLQDRQ